MVNSSDSYGMRNRARDLGEIAQKNDKECPRGRAGCCGKDFWSAELIIAGVDSYHPIIIEGGP